MPLCVYLCVCVCSPVDVPVKARGVRPHEARVTGICEPKWVLRIEPCSSAEAVQALNS